MINYIMSIDVELCDVVENVIDVEVDVEGMTLDKKSLTKDRK